MQISCSIALVQPSLLSSKAKISWKVKASSLATAAFLGVQELKPSRFNFSRSFSCCTATKRGSGHISLPGAACTSWDNSAGGMGNVDSSYAILKPSSNGWGCPTCCVPQQIANTLFAKKVFLPVFLFRVLLCPKRALVLGELL